MYYIVLLYYFNVLLKKLEFLSKIRYCLFIFAVIK